MKEQQLKDLMLDIILQKYAKNVSNKIKQDGIESLSQLEKAKYDAAVELSSSEDTPKRSLYDQVREKHQKPFTDELRNHILDASNRLYRLGQNSNFDINLRQFKLTKTLSFIEKLDQAKLNVLRSNPIKYKEFCMRAHMDMERPNINGRLKHLQTYLNIVLDLEDAPVHQPENNNNNGVVIAVSTPILTDYHKEQDPKHTKHICQILEPLLPEPPINLYSTDIIDHVPAQAKSKLRASTMFKGLLDRVTNSAKAMFTTNQDMMSKAAKLSVAALCVAMFIAPNAISNEGSKEILGSFNSVSEVAPEIYTDMPEIDITSNFNNINITVFNNINITVPTLDSAPVILNKKPASLPDNIANDMSPSIAMDTTNPEAMSVAPTFNIYINDYDAPSASIFTPTKPSSDFYNMAASSLTEPVIDIPALPPTDPMEYLSMSNVADAIKDFYADQDIEFTSQMETELNRIQYGINNNITGHAEMRVQEWGVKILNDFGSDIASNFAWELNKLIERQDGSFMAKNIVENDLERWSTVQGHYKFTPGA